MKTKPTQTSPGASTLIGGHTDHQRGQAGALKAVLGAKPASTERAKAFSSAGPKASHTGVKPYGGMGALLGNAPHPPRPPQHRPTKSISAGPVGASMPVRPQKAVAPVAPKQTYGPTKPKTWR